MRMDDTAPPSPSIDHLFALIRERYGARLTDAQLAEVRRGVEAVEHAVRALRAVRLDNADEPMPPFVPFRAEP
jgi:hypothetical protein